MKFFNYAILTFMLAGIGVRSNTIVAPEKDEAEQLEKLTTEVEKFLAKFSKHLVNADSDCLVELSTEDVISVMIGKPPTFGKNALKAQVENLFKYVSYPHHEYTIEEVGEVNDMVYAWGVGTGYNSTEANAVPQGSMKYERVFKRDENDDLRMYIQTLYRPPYTGPYSG